MISVKNKHAQNLMATAGAYLAELFAELSSIIIPGISTYDIDTYIERYLIKNQLHSSTKGFGSYRHSSCISINDELVHGVPRPDAIIPEVALVKVDICASWKGYCADAARCYTIGTVSPEAQHLTQTAQKALNAGILQAIPGNHIGDISGAIQDVIELTSFGIVQNFAGHGIGKHMHEDPEILNFRTASKGPRIREGMAFALEPMITAGKCDITVDPDGWTARTADRSWTAHVEDTIIITDEGPHIITRLAGYE